MSVESIISKIDQNKEIYIEFLRKLIQSDSVNPPGNEKNVALIIEDFLKGIGMILAHLYELLPIESQIEDYPGNITRFLVIGNQVPDQTGNDKTSIMFATSHVPGALFKALDPVDKAGLNMLKLESRPIKGQQWSYYFFLDIEGHIKDQKIAKTIEIMKKITLSLKILGSYPAFVPEEI